MVRHRAAFSRFFHIAFVHCRFWHASYHQKLSDWKREVQQTLARAISENHSIDIAALELNTLKMAMNITFQNLREVVLPSLLRQVDVAKGPQSVNAVFKQWAKLVSRFTHGEEDQANVLSILQVGFCCSEK